MSHLPVIRYSYLAQWRKCPRMHELDKSGTRASTALSRGSEIDKMVTDYLNGANVDFPELKMADLELQLSGLRAIGARPQVVEAAELDTPAGKVKLQATMDIVYGENIIDIKTGQKYPEHADQLEIYALVHSKCAPGTIVEVSDWYVDLDKKESDVFGAGDLAYLAEKWADVIGRYLFDELRDPTPSYICHSFCPHAARHGGGCEYGSDKHI